MDNYLIKNITPLNVIDNGFYLVVLYANTIPPHLGIIYNKKYFSLTVKGQTLGEDVNGLLKLINKKKIETLLFKLTDCEEKTGLLKLAFQEQNQVTKTITCLYPIKNILAKLFDTKISYTKFVYEILPILYDGFFITKTLHINMHHLLKNNAFTFRKYTMENIVERIKLYEKKEQC